MKRGVIYTKKNVMFILEDVVKNDIRARDAYLAPGRAEEGFEKRAVLEFLHWFADKALPENLAVDYEYKELEEDYPEEAARAIAEGKGWAASRLRTLEDEGGEDDNVVLVDFTPRD